MTSRKPYKPAYLPGHLQKQWQEPKTHPLLLSKPLGLKAEADRRHPRRQVKFIALMMQRP